MVVDAAGYRARRAEALERQAEKAANEAVRFGRPVSLDAMVASERRVVHEFLRDRHDVETYSEGDEPDRHLVVAPVVSCPRVGVSRETSRRPERARARVVPGRGRG